MKFALAALVAIAACYPTHAEMEEGL